MTSLCAFLLCIGAAAANQQATAGANPIRKIVTLMQNMQKEIEAEGAKEQELFDKFMCYCSGNNGDLAKASADGRAKIEELSAKLKMDEADKTQTGLDLAQHKADREGAANDLSEATNLRSKENAEFTEQQADTEKNIAAMKGAIPALEKGMGGASLMQLPGSDRLHKLVESYSNVDAMDRKNVLAFLEQSGDYVPQSGQIVGILKGMLDQMEADLKELNADEDKGVAGFADLKGSKEKEQETATEAIETKTARAGELAVSVVQTADALEDTQKEVAETDKFIAELKASCATKSAENAKRQKTRTEEVAAISQAIEILNDDDALDVFKKAVPSALVQESFGFLQRSDRLASQVAKAQAILAQSAGKYKSQQMNLLLYSLNSKLKLGVKGKTQNFAGVIKMVDDMVALLGKDQADDDKQKVFCEGEFDKAGDEDKAAQTKLGQIEATIEEEADAIASLADELATLDADIKALDKAVVEATEQRKEEHAEHQETAQLTEAAVALIGKAKNRLQKFYNPTLYVDTPVHENTMEEKIIEAGSFAQVHSHDSVAPAPPPETAGGAYQASSKSAGVMGLMDMMVKELETDAKDGDYEEKEAQKDYSELMASSQATRAQDTKSMTDKAATKAQLEGKHQSSKESRTATQQDLDLVHTYIGDLHVSCDFILQNFDLRREARTNEGESLKNAKAILSGANFGL